MQKWIEGVTGSGYNMFKGMENKACMCLLGVTGLADKLSHAKALLGGELTKAQGNKYGTVEEGRGGRRKGRLEITRIQDFWIDLGLPPP